MPILKSYCLRCALLPAALFWAAQAMPAPGGGDIAVVVRPDVPVDNLSFAEVRRLMLGDRQY